MTDPILHKEQEAELAQNKLDGEAIREMVRTRGWKDILEPKLRSRRESLVGKFSNASELKDFITCQQAINAIDNLFRFVESSIILGEQAADALEQQKEAARQEIVDVT